MKIKLKRKAALAYAKAGIPIFPTHYISDDGMCSCGNPECGTSGGKHPIFNGGYKNATTDPEQIKAWWSQKPYNIAVATGKDSIICLDVDGPDGKDSLDRLEKQYGPIPETVTVKTGNGFHNYFKAPHTKIPCSTGTIAKGIDVRGDGGHAILPPSDHYKGGSYAFSDGLNPENTEYALMPDWLIQLAIKEKESKAKETAKSEQVIPLGKRNDTLFKRGCGLRGKGSSSKDILKNLLKINTERCKPSLDESEVKRICSSVCQYKKGDQKALSKFFVDDLIASVKLFHTPLREAYVKFPVHDHTEVWPIRSKDFRNYCQGLYYQRFKITLKKNFQDEILDLFEAKAKFDSPEEEVYVRTAGDFRTIYVDLANDNWEVVKITVDGYTVIKDTPINFCRPKSQFQKS